MIKKNLFSIAIFIGSFLFAQQNREFKAVKEYYDYQRVMISSEMKKRYENGQNAFEKNVAKKDFILFMQKMDSLQNTAFIGALISVRNREDLSRLQNFETIEEVKLKPNKKITLEKKAEYPGGIDTMRKHVAELFYLDAVIADEKTLKTDVHFIVEQDGSISSVHAEGNNFTFNRQAEIAIYRLPDKFSPAMIKGNAVRYHFRLPLTMNFE